MVYLGQAPTSLQIATCPVNWNNNDLENWRPVTPFPALLDEMKSAGYTATEFDASFGSDVDVVTSALESRGMQLTGSYQWVDFLEGGDVVAFYDTFRPMMQFLSQINCPNLIVSDPLRPHRIAMAGRVPADGSASLDDASVQQIAAGVHTLAGIAGEYGLRVRYHNHVGSWIEAPHEVDALLQHLDLSQADLCFDTGHYAYGGGISSHFIESHMDAIGYLHLKDVDTDAVEDARTRELTFLAALREIVFAPIGTGTADIPAILGTLTSAGYGGWVVVEQDTCAGDSTTAARQNLAFINNWLNMHSQAAR